MTPEQAAVEILDEGTSTTLMGYTQTYDKHGRPQGRDPNTSTSNYRCMVCGNSWEIRSRDGMEDMVEAFRPQPQKATS